MTLVEQVARGARPSLWRAFDAHPDSHWTRQKRLQELVFTGRVVRGVLAAMREPGETVRLAGNLEADGQRQGGAISAAEIWREMHRAFAREHGIEP